MADIVADIPNIFDYTQWDFSPETVLEEERAHVEGAAPNGDLTELLRLMPGKHPLSIAALQCGLSVRNYVGLIIGALADESAQFESLRNELVAALAPFLPPRSVS